MVRRIGTALRKIAVVRTTAIYHRLRPSMVYTQHMTNLLAVTLCNNSERAVFDCELCNPFQYIFCYSMLAHDNHAYCSSNWA